MARRPVPRAPRGLSEAGPGPATGTYVVHVSLPAALTVMIRKRRRGGVGTAKVFRLLAGEYLYVGSAFGPGGLARRVARHLAGGAQRRHWDLDFLLAHGAALAQVEAWGRASDDRQAECRWAAALLQGRGSHAVNGERQGRVIGFGAGDCRRRCGCGPGVPAARRTHLLRVEWAPTRAAVSRRVGEALVALGAGGAR